MLRSAELLGARRDELFDLDGDNPRFDVPLKRVKKRPGGEDHSGSAGGR
jgi:hypothetical protein